MKYKARSRRRTIKNTNQGEDDELRDDQEAIIARNDCTIKARTRDLMKKVWTSVSVEDLVGLSLTAPWYLERRRMILGNIQPKNAEIAGGRTPLTSVKVPCDFSAHVCKKGTHAWI